MIQFRQNLAHYFWTSLIVLIGILLLIKTQLNGRIIQKQEVLIEQKPAVVEELIADMSYYYLWYPEAFANQEYLTLSTWNGLYDKSLIFPAYPDSLKIVTWKDSAAIIHCATLEHNDRIRYEESFFIDSYLGKTRLTWKYRDIQVPGLWQRISHGREVRQRIHEGSLRFKKFCEAYRPVPTPKRGKRGYLAIMGTHHRPMK